MYEEIVAGYGFYMGWSFGMAVVLMLGEWIFTNIQRKAVVRRLQRMARLNTANSRN